MNVDQAIVRVATAEDIPALLDLYTHLIADDPLPATADAAGVLEQLMAIKGSAIVVAELDGVLTSSCTLLVIPNLTRGLRPYALIENVVTHTDYRQRGLGRQVLDAACQAAWDAGCYKVMLLTGSDRPETHKFYCGVGFEQNKTGFQKRQIPVRRPAS